MIANVSENLKYANERADCAVRAIAVCCEVPYELAYKAAEKHGREPNKGTGWHTIVRAFNELGYALLWYETPARTIRTLERDLPKVGSFLISVREHVLGYHNGEAVDWAAGRCKHVRSVWRIKRFRNLTKHDKDYLRQGQLSPSGKFHARPGKKIPREVVLRGY